MLAKRRGERLPGLSAQRRAEHTVDRGCFPAGEPVYEGGCCIQAAFPLAFISPDNGDYFYSVEMFHLFRHDDHKLNPRMNYPCHDTAHRLLFWRAFWQFNV